MSTASRIEWTDATWNPTTGCDQVSDGCDNCYALSLAKRLKAMGSDKYQTDGDLRTSGPGFGIATHARTLDEPLSWTTPRMVFVNSMSDLFHRGVSKDFLARVFAVMAATPQHTYQVLTKRHARMHAVLNSIAFREMVRTVHFLRFGGDLPAWPLLNAWLGISAENQQWANIRIPALYDTPAVVRFVSCEPLLSAIDLRAIRLAGGTPISAIDIAYDQDSGQPSRGIDWVIVGGESGHGARPMHPAWARSLRDQCQSATVPFFFKQRGAWTWEQPSRGRGEPDAYVCEADGRVASEADALADGGSWQGAWRVGKKAAGSLLDGQTWAELPSVPRRTA